MAQNKVVFPYFYFLFENRTNRRNKFLQTSLLDVLNANLDVFPPGYEDEGEAEGDEDEEEGSNDLCTA